MLEQRAIAVIHKHVLFGVLGFAEIAACVKRNPHFNSETKEGRRPFSTEYAFAAMTAVSPILNWAHTYGHNEPINFVFEDGGAGKGLIYNALTDMRKMPSVEYRHLIGSVTNADKTLVTQLQAADSLVYEGCKVVTDRLANRISPSSMLEWLDAAKVYIVGFMDDEKFPDTMRRGMEIDEAKEKFKKAQRDKASKRKDENEN